MSIAQFEFDDFEFDLDEVQDEMERQGMSWVFPTSKPCVWKLLTQYRREEEFELARMPFASKAETPGSS